MRLAAVALLAPALIAPLSAQSPGKPDPSLVAAGTYEVDPDHTQVTWTVNHLGFSLLQGQFGASGGQIAIDPARLGATRLEVTFNTDQLSTTSSAFTKHLKSDDFFNVATYPTARFVSRGVAVSGTQGTVTGDLTIKNITKPVTLQVRLVGAGVSPMDKKLNFGFRATGSIKRSDFGLGMAVPAVSDRVELQINAAFQAA